MKTTLLLFSYFLSLAICSSQNMWTEKNPFPSQRHGMVSFVIDGTAYCGLGSDGYSENNFYNDFYQYNEAQDSWTAISNFPGDGRKDAVAFAIGGNAFVGLGNGYTGEFDDFYQYNPQTAQWTVIEQFPGGARSSAIAFVIEGKAYVGTGRGDSNYKDMYAYDATVDSWSPIADFSFVVHNAVAFSIGGKGYVCSGLDVSTSGTMQYSGVDEFDPATNLWTEKIFSDSRLQNRHYGTSWVHDGIAYIAGGNINAEKVITYNPVTNTIEDYNDFGNGQDEFQNPTSFILGDVSYVVGGLTWEGTSIFNSYSVNFDAVWALNYNGTPSAIQGNRARQVELRAYPNPSDGTFFISGLQKNATYSIFDTSGVIIETGTVEMENLCPINLANYPDGLFFFKSGNHLIKLIKQ